MENAERRQRDGSNDLEATLREKVNRMLHVSPVYRRNIKPII